MKSRNIAAVVLGLFLMALAGSASAARDDWLNLSPRQKEQIRDNINRWDKLPPQDKDRVRDARKYWERLPKDQRDRIKQRYDEQRRNRDRDND